MILQSLVKYYEALEKNGKITSPGFCLAKISFALELSKDGELIRVIPLKQEVQRGKKMVSVPRNLVVPQMVSRSSGISANFLCDNSSYLLGMDKKGRPERSLECFEAAKAKHMEILNNISSDKAQAVYHYFETWNPKQAQDNPALKDYLEEILEGVNLVFWVGDDFAHNDEDIKKAWKHYQNASEKGLEGICLVTGQRAEISRIHGTIKGVAGAQSSGAALVSFNAPAFESYGKEQSYNAPVSTYAVYAYTTALNYLLSDKTHTTIIGDSTVVYWSEDGEEEYQNVFLSVTEPTIENQEIIDGVFKNLELGKAVDVEDVSNSLSMEKRFYILGLAPNAARLAVRFFYQDSFGNILKHIKRHYDEMKIVKPAANKIEYLGIWKMLQETVNKKSKDKKPVPNMAGAVFKSVLSGSPYPGSLYQAVLGRIRSEQDDKDHGIYKITRGRAAIIKAFLLRNANYSEEEITMSLNEDSNQVAYVLGREFAVLEAIQEDANPGLNATIKDRYFNAACATPASIFPILFKLKNSHIRKMGNKAKEVYYEKMLGNLQDKIMFGDNGQTAIPKRLSLEEQGLFILGYYHQNQKRFEKKSKEEVSGDNNS